MKSLSINLMALVLVVGSFAWGAEDPDKTVSCQVRYTFSSFKRGQDVLAKCLAEGQRKCIAQPEEDVKGPLLESTMTKKGGLLGDREVDYYGFRQGILVPGSKTHPEDFDFIVSLNYTHHRDSDDPKRILGVHIINKFQNERHETTYHVIPGRGINGITVIPGEGVLKIVNHPSNVKLDRKYKDDTVKSIDLKCTYQKNEKPVAEEP